MDIDVDATVRLSANVRTAAARSIRYDSLRRPSVSIPLSGRAEGVYVKVGCPSACPVDRQQQRRPAGLLLSAVLAGDIVICKLLFPTHDFFIYIVYIVLETIIIVYCILRLVSGLWPFVAQ